MKKILKTILILVLIGAFALFLFWLINPSSTPTQNNFLSRVRNFSPFGNNTPDIGTNVDQRDELVDDTQKTLPADRTLPPVEMIYGSPVGGYTLINSGTSTRVRVVDRSTGHIIDINPLTKEQTRISNTTLPRIMNAVWFNEGTSVIMQYTKEQSDVVETLLVSNINTDNQEITGAYLEEGIADIYPISSSEIAYVVPHGFGSRIHIYNSTNDASQTILTSTIRGWKIIGSSPGGLYLQTKASYVSPGYIYFLSKQNGQLIKIYGGTIGLNAIMSNDNTKILITSGGRGPFALFMDQNTGNNTFIDVSTVADKCVYGTERTTVYCAVPVQFPDRMPDTWYMGLTTLTDQIWGMSDDGTLSFVTGLPNIDATKLHVSTDGQDLFLVHKPDGSVWIIRLHQL